MTAEFNAFDANIVPAEEASKHALWSEIRDERALRIFMEHHVYAVWDFMVLAKKLQNIFAPSVVRSPWAPRYYPPYRRFVTEIILDEESDSFTGPNGKQFYGSHYELYLSAMNEIGADTDTVRRMVASAPNCEGFSPDIWATKLNLSGVPDAAVDFMTTTFDAVAFQPVHELAAFFAVGREQVIPQMFSEMLKNLGVLKEAPLLEAYLNRHVEVDGDSHGPIARRMVTGLASNTKKREESIQAGLKALTARIQLWDGILPAIRG